jgi:hypothetical protein
MTPGHAINPASLAVCSAPDVATQALNSLNSAERDLCAREERLTRALQSGSTERLISVLEKIVTRSDQLESGGGALVIPSNGALPRLNHAGALRVGAELTRRGIAPVFRGMPYYCAAKGPASPWWHDCDTDLLALSLDAQWLACRYPHHRTEWQRAASIFDPSKFRATCGYLHWDGKRTPGQIAKALALSDEQQAELAYLHCLHVERRKQKLWGRWRIAKEEIEAGVRQNDKRPTDQQDATISRRSGLWLAAELGHWKPTRSSDLYAMQPEGTRLARNVVAKQLEKLPRVRRVD